MSQPRFQQQVSNYASNEPIQGGERQNNSYYGYPPLPINYHHHQTPYRDNFAGSSNFVQLQSHPVHYHHCPPYQSYVPAWSLKNQQQQSSQQHPETVFSGQSSQIKPDSSSPQLENMELAHSGGVLHHEIKPDPLHLNLLNLPTSQTGQPSIPPPLLSHLHSNTSMDSNITLWQFLLEMLTNNDHPELIQWTNNEGEFKLLDAEAVARLWGVRKGKHQMNYDKLSRALRYYYDKNIIKKVNGQKFVYRFVVPSDSANADILSFTMQRSMGIQGQSSIQSALPPPSSFPHPTPHSVMNSSVNDQRYYRRSVSSSVPTIKTEPDVGSSGASNSRALIVSNTASTPSPINSTCSPGSSSGVSSAGTSASNLSDVYHHDTTQQNPTQSATGSFSRPSSTASNSTQQQQNNRKRKREDTGISIDKIKIEPTSHCYNGINENVFMDAHSPTNGIGLSRRGRPKPSPLDLSAVSNVNNNLSSLNNNATNAMNNLMAVASPLLQSSPALLNIYAATLSANFMQQNQPSPLSTFTAAALASPLNFAAAAMAASPSLNPLNNNNLSMFGNSLSALTTPIPNRTPQQPQNTQSHGQFFQFPPSFPPSSQASAHFALAAALLRSPGIHSPFLTAMGLSTGLGTPTTQNTGTKFNMSPNDALKTPIPPIREV